MIVRLKSGYVVRGEDGRHLGGPYEDRADAEKRLHQVEHYGMRPRFRKGRKNPLGSGLGFGVLIGAGLVGAVWGIVYYRDSKKAAVISTSCSLCLVPTTGTVPAGATQVSTSSYKGFPVSSYYISSDFGWGATVSYGPSKNAPGTDSSDSVWSQASAAAALAAVKVYVDKQPIA